MNPAEIAQIAYLALQVLFAAVILVIVLLFIASRFQKKETPTPSKVLRRCEGVRQGETCRKTLYKCDNCGEIGCEMSGCSNRGFRKTDCERCEATNSREDIHEYK